MMPFRRLAVQSVRRFHTGSLTQFPIPESSSKASQMSSQHTAGTGMNEPGAYKSGPNASTSTKKATTETSSTPANKSGKVGSQSTQSIKSDAQQMAKDTAHGQHAQPNKYSTWDSADSDSTVGIQSLNKKAATRQASTPMPGAGVVDSAKATVAAAAEKLKAAVGDTNTGDIKSTINNVLHKAKETVTNVTHKVTDTASTVSSKMQDTKQNMSEKAANMGDRMEHKFTDFAERISASGEALDARDAAPEDSDLNVPADAKPIGQQPNPKDPNDVMEGVPGMTKQGNQKTEGMTDKRRGGQM